MDTPSTSRLSPSVRRLLRLGVAVTVLLFCGLAASRLDLTGAARALAQAHPLWLLLAILLNIPIFLILTLRWRFLLGRSGKISFLSLLRYILASRAASNVLPARAGDLLRIYLPHSRDGLPAVTVTSTLIIERFFDASGLALLLAPLLLLLPAISWIRTGLLILVSAGVAGLIVTYAFALRGGRNRQSVLDRIGESAEVLRDTKMALLLLGLSVAYWAGDGLMITCCLTAVDLPTVPQVVLLVLLAVNLGMILQVTPGNVGPFEAAALLALAALDIGGPRALAFALLYHLVQFIPITLVGFEGLRFVGEARRVG